MGYIVVGCICAFCGYMLAALTHSASIYSRDGEDK